MSTAEETDQFEEGVVINIPKNLIEDDEGGMRYGSWHISPPYKATPVEKQSIRPRLVIFKIVNNNFKSYQGTKIIGPFDTHFTAIVGPNGSGKSNVIDSMMFVFGYRANRIRSERLGVLVHNSANFQNISHCSVEVQFRTIIDNNNADGFIEVEDGILSIGRVAYRNNTSYYTINGKKALFTDISNLLKEKGIDLKSNRFLILQGEVEQISLMKPKSRTIHGTGLLEYLDDIIGSSRYKQPISEVSEAVEILIRETSSEERLLNELKSDVAALAGPCDAAVKYLEHENTLFQLQHYMIQKTLYQHNLQYEKIKTKKEITEKDVESLNQDLLKVRDKKSKAESLAKEGSRTIANLYAEKEKLEKALTKANNDDAELQELMKKTNKWRKEQKVRKKSEEDNLNNLLQIPAKNDANIKEMSEQMSRLEIQKEAEQSKLDTCLSSLKEQTQILVEQREIVHTKLVGLQKAVEDSKSAFELMKSERQIALRNQNQQETMLKSLIKQETETKENLAVKSKLLMEVTSELQVITNNVTDLQIKLQTTKNELPKLHANLQAKKEKLNEYYANSTSTSGCRELEFLLQKSREGHVTGIFGRLGDLGGIDLMYDVAISTACGPLDNIVVEDDEVAEECINLLKKYNAGRATFIALNKQQHLWKFINTPFHSPENVPRLFDLITVTDNRVLPAFYYALRDTLVCQKLDQASRIAYGQQRYRVVTLKGEIIETSGTMSGGGSRQSRGRMGQTVAVDTKRSSSALTTAEEADQMQNYIEEIASHIYEMETMLHNFEDQIKKEGRKMSDKKTYLERLAAEVKSLSEYLPLQKQQVARQRVKTIAAKVDPERVNMLDKLVSEKESAFKKAKKMASVTESEVNKFTDQINDITSTRVKTMENKVNSLNEKLKKLKNTIYKLNVEIKTSKRNCLKSEKNISFLQVNIEEAENKITQLQKKIEDLEQTARTTITSLDQVTIKIKEVSLKYKNVKGDISKLAEKEHNLRSKRIELKRCEQEMQTSFAKVSALVEEQKKKLRKIVLHEEYVTVKVGPLKMHSPEELARYTMGQLEDSAQRVQEKMKKLNNNVDAIRKYNETNKRREEVEKKYNNLVEQRDDVQTLKEYWRLRRIDEFMIGFSIISLHLKEIFQCLALGGDADLDLVDPTDPYTQGINFNIKPCNKTWNMVQNLSGGEKTLSSLALILALHNYRPSPIYFMDEIDAALDYKNIAVAGHFIKARTGNTQFIVVSLRSEMFELADRLCGIYKESDVTQAITINNNYAKIQHSNVMSMSQRRSSVEHDEAILMYQFQQQQQEEQQSLLLLSPSPSISNSYNQQFSNEKQSYINEVENRSQQNSSTQNSEDIISTYAGSTYVNELAKTSSDDNTCDKSTVSQSSDVSDNDVSIKSSEKYYKNTSNTKICNYNNNSEAVDTAQFVQNKHLNTTSSKRIIGREVNSSNSANPFILFTAEDVKNVENFKEENNNKQIHKSCRRQLKRKLESSSNLLTNSECPSISSINSITDNSTTPISSEKGRHNTHTTHVHSTKVPSLLNPPYSSRETITRADQPTAAKKRRLLNSPEIPSPVINNKRVPRSPRLHYFVKQTRRRKNYDNTESNYDISDTVSDNTILLKNVSVNLEQIDLNKMNKSTTKENNDKSLEKFKTLTRRQVINQIFKIVRKPQRKRRRKNKRKPPAKEQIKNIEPKEFRKCYVKLIKID